MTEMVCVSAEGRITPGCGGLYRDDHVPGWRRIVDFVHGHGPARIGCQIGHSGRKGATKLLWEGDHVPLEDPWEVMAPSALPYFPESPVPREMDRAAMDEVRDQFVAAAAAGRGGGVRPAGGPHGPRLPAVVVPLAADQPAHRRVRRRPGRARASFPLEVFDACRAVWPADKPMSARISATDWYAGRLHRRRCGRHWRRCWPSTACDLVDVSTGQVWPDQKPAYGRSYQTPFADRIRHEVGIATMAVGAISSVRRRQHDHPRRPRRPVRARPPAPLRPLLDPARRRRPGLRGALDRQLRVRGHGVPTMGGPTTSRSRHGRLTRPSTSAPQRWRLAHHGAHRGVTIGCPQPRQRNTP